MSQTNKTVLNLNTHVAERHDLPHVGAVCATNERRISVRTTSPARVALGLRAALASRETLASTTPLSTTLLELIAVSVTCARRTSVTRVNRRPTQKKTRCLVGARQQRMFARIATPDEIERRTLDAGGVGERRNERRAQRQRRCERRE